MDDTLQAIADESRRAHGKYGPPTSAHESLGVLIEEVGELREAIRANDPELVLHEAVQVASVAHRLIQACAGGDAAFYKRSGFVP